MNDTALTVTDRMSDADIALIKQTVAKGATDSELKLFLYRAKKMGLDPLKMNQIYFVKYGQNPGTIVIGLDGFRSIAAKTGKHVGTKRGVIRDDSGKCVGAWCEVYRSDWKEPAREEVSLHEYDTGKAMWARMKETMIKKVAEVAALRMAFPDDLGGVFADEELDTAREREAKMVEVSAVIEKTESRPEFETVLPPPQTSDESEIGSYLFKTGSTKRKGKKVSSFPIKFLEETLKWYDDSVIANKVLSPEVQKTIAPEVQEDMFYIKSYLDEQNDKGN